MAKILLVDDDKEFCSLLTEYINNEDHHDVDILHDGMSCVEKIKSDGASYNLVMLDVTMPKLNGFETLKEVRKSSNIPVIMLTARGGEVDRIVGLELGADDYIPKPFSLRELSARIHALLRRVNMVNSQSYNKKTIHADDLVLNLKNREMYKGSQQISLTAKEFLIIKILIENRGSVITREQLTEQALGRKLELYDRSIDMHVSNLRNKLGEKQNGGPRIKTVRGLGYFYDH